MNISDLSNLLRPGTLTKLSLGAVCPLFAKTSEEEIIVRPTKLAIKGRQNVKGEGSKTKRAKSHAKGPNPRVPYMVLPPKLGSEDCHATPRTRSGNRPSCLYWT